MSKIDNTEVIANKQVMVRFLEFINTGDRTIGEKIIDPNVVFYAPTSPEPLRGLDGYMAVLEMMRGAMPDVQWAVEEIIAENDKVMIRFTLRGTQTKPFMGMPATGKQVSITAMNIYQLKDQKIVLEHGLPDMFSMLIQLGAIPAPTN
ncbi:MAG: ester cyclase [Brevinema sp.]